MAITWMDRAKGEAGWITNELWKRTGHQYEVKAFSLGNTRCVDIVDLHTNNVVKAYRAHKGSWRTLYEQIRASYDTYLTIINA